jgi:hypothetical protein
MNRPFVDEARISLLTDELPLSAEACGKTHRNMPMCVVKRRHTSFSCGDSTMKTLGKTVVGAPK